MWLVSIIMFAVMYLCAWYTIIDIQVRFVSKRYSGSEAIGFVSVTLELIGGVSTYPFSVTVTPSELSLASAKGNSRVYIDVSLNEASYIDFLHI